MQALETIFFNSVPFLYGAMRTQARTSSKRSPVLVPTFAVVPRS
jgi:hypothetical protein